MPSAMEKQPISPYLEGEEIQTFSEKFLEDLFSETNHIDNIEIRDGDVILSIIDSDPWFIIDNKITDSIPEYIQQHGNSIFRSRILYASILALIACTLICLRNRILCHAKTYARLLEIKCWGKAIKDLGILVRPCD